MMFFYTMTARSILRTADVLVWLCNIVMIPSPLFFLSLFRENELLKHQLKKYVSAVQMLRNESSNKEETLGIHLDAQPQPSIPPAKQMIDYSHEASEYEKKLIQVSTISGYMGGFQHVLFASLLIKVYMTIITTIIIIIIIIFQCFHSSAFLQKSAISAIFVLPGNLHTWFFDFRKKKLAKKHFI